MLDAYDHRLVVRADRGIAQLEATTIVSTALPSPIQRGLVLLVALALALAAFVPLVLPSRADAISADVVISEFRTRGPNGAADEFVELYNGSPAPVDVGGWIVRRSNNAGVINTQVTIPAGTMIGPGCFYLITNSTGYTGATTPDQTYGVGIGDDGGIGVISDLPATVDAAGMSVLSAFQEGTLLAPLTTNVDRGYERLPGGTAGHLDTDNNAADFAVLAPSNPQNSASPCIGSGESTAPFGTGSANPASVLPGATTTLSVTVTPGTNPASTGVTVVADLTAIGGSAMQPFADPEADGTFTHVATVVAGTTPGVKSLPATIADAEGRSSTTSIGLTVEAPPTQIWEIQGASHLSSFDGQQVFGVEGVVTARASNGFWMTDPTPDADPGHLGRDLRVPRRRHGRDRPGDGQRHRRRVPLRRLRRIQEPDDHRDRLANGDRVSGGNALPTHRHRRRSAAADARDRRRLDLHGRGGDAVFDPAKDGIDFWESLEGMRLEVADAVAVGPRAAARIRSEIAVVSQRQAGAGRPHAARRHPRSPARPGR